MSFSSVSFFVFMIAVFLIYWGIPHKFRYILLIFANLIFYASFGAKCVPILLAEILVAYLFAQFLEVTDDSKKTSGRKLLLAVGILLTVSPLLVFKYLNFTIYTVDKVLGLIAAPVSDHTLKLLAPIGISFYTFESLSYIVDVYNGKLKAENNIFKLLAFISFFPNITSGPIERADGFLKQLDIEKKFDYDRTVYGLRLVLLGMIKKICGADILKQYADAVFGNIYAYKGPVFIIAIVLYTFEIYLDFSGYTDMARGLAAMLGFDLKENFRAPYLSNGIKEFWSRWHISLSQWLRDYIYIPLGGSRCSKVRKYINLMITFIVSGIWHGASFTFIFWGVLHGLYQCGADILANVSAKRKNIENRGKTNTYLQNDKSNTNYGALNGVDSGTGYITNQEAKYGTAKKVLRILVTFALVSFAWMFFRANSLSDAKYIVMNMLIGTNLYGQLLQMGFLTASAYISVLVIIGLTVVYDIFSEKKNLVLEFGRLSFIMRWVIYIVAGVLVVVLRSHIGSGADFIYFKF